MIFLGDALDELIRDIDSASNQTRMIINDIAQGETGERPSTLEKGVRFRKKSLVRNRVFSSPEEAQEHDMYTADGFANLELLSGIEKIWGA